LFTILHLSTCFDTKSPKYLEMAQGHISLSPSMSVSHFPASATPSSALHRRSTAAYSPERAAALHRRLLRSPRAPACSACSTATCSAARPPAQPAPPPPARPPACPSARPPPRRRLLGRPTPRRLLLARPAPPAAAARVAAVVVPPRPLLAWPGSASHRRRFR
jgi:hypothetical protein